MASGACYVTLAEHAAPVTGVAFLPSASALVSASLDGTLRAWDLVRYRCFRTMTTPAPVQFASLAVDPSGEVRPRAPESLFGTLLIKTWALSLQSVLQFGAASVFVFRTMFACLPSMHAAKASAAGLQVAPCWM